MRLQETVHLKEVLDDLLGCAGNSTLGKVEGLRAVDFVVDETLSQVERFELQLSSLLLQKLNLLRELKQLHYILVTNTSQQSRWRGTPFEHMENSHLRSHYHFPGLIRHHQVEEFWDF